MRVVDVLMDKLITLPVLVLPQSQGQYTIDTDTCDTLVGCVLLAVVLTVIMVSAYLEGLHFIIQT